MGTWHGTLSTEHQPAGDLDRGRGRGTRVCRLFNISGDVEPLWQWWENSTQYLINNSHPPPPPSFIIIFLSANGVPPLWAIIYFPLFCQASNLTTYMKRKMNLAQFPHGIFGFLLPPFSWPQFKTFPTLLIWPLFGSKGS